MIQDELLHGLAQLDGLCPLGDGGECPPNNNECADCSYRHTTAKEILSYLHSKGVVIKADRELPENPYVCKHEWPCSACAFAEGQAILIGAHYVEVKPLIKEGG